MSIDADTRARVLVRDGFKCGYCNRAVRWGSSEIDHIKPVSQGGGDEIENLVTACVRCNQEKSGSTPREWFGSPEERAWTEFFGGLMVGVGVGDGNEIYCHRPKVIDAAELADQMLDEWRRRWSR